MKPDCRPLLLAFLTLLPAAPAVMAADWRKELFNPQPDPADILIPLPCDGQLVLRRVNTGQVSPADPAAPLADKEFTMGRPAEAGRSFIESRRPEFIAGTAGDPDGTRYYLIGKYEVTVGQFRAVMAIDAASCPQRLGPADALPRGDLSWYDAIEFTRRLNAWLYADPDRLAAVVAATGTPDPSVRLPTEAEWEFAARGGLAVSDAERAAPRFPGPEDSIDPFAWTNAPQSAQGKPKPIGTRRPNPLGLYDVYGNVAEMVLDPFRLTRGDRLHGETGGFVVRGGSFLDDPQVVNSAVRDEYPLFSSAGEAGEFRLRSNGMRVVFGGAILNRTADIDALARAASQITSSATTAIAPATTADLQRLTERHQGSAVGRDLRSVQDRLAGELARREETEARLVRSLILNAAMMAREMRLTSNLMDVLYDFSNDSLILPAEREAYTQKFQAHRASLRLYAAQYADVVQSLSGSYIAISEAQIPALRRELLDRGNTPLYENIDIVQRSLDDYANGRTTNIDSLTKKVIGQNHHWQ